MKKDASRAQLNPKLGTKIWITPAKIASAACASLFDISFWLCLLLRRFLFVCCLLFLSAVLAFNFNWFLMFSHHGSTNTTPSSLTWTLPVTGRFSRTPNTHVAASPVHAGQCISWIVASNPSTWATSWHPDLCLPQGHPKLDASTPWQHHALDIMWYATFTWPSRRTCLVHLFSVPYQRTTPNIHGVQSSSHDQSLHLDHLGSIPSTVFYGRALVRWDRWCLCTSWRRPTFGPAQPSSSSLDSRSRIWHDWQNSLS